MKSLVIPIYKNETNIAALLEAVAGIGEVVGPDFEAVFVVDGSPDRSLDLLREALPRQAFRAQLVALSRNFGSFAAIRMGLSVAQGKYFAVMAADLQEPPTLVQTFFHVLEHEPVDVVVGQRQGRGDPLASRISAQLFWGVYRWLIQPEVPSGGVDVFGCGQAVRDQLLLLNESNSSLVGLLFWLGFRRRVIPYQRLQRRAGKSAWSLRRKWRYMIDSAFAFTDLPITLLLSIGGLGMLVSLVIALAVTVAWLLGLTEVAGYTPLMLTIVFSVSALFFSQGLLGGYIWRTFENTKRRPLFVPMLHEIFGSEGRA
jgi:glycosyltransferase involved in cell wall biosynthesis